MKQHAIRDNPEDRRAVRALMTFDNAFCSSWHRVDCLAAPQLPPTGPAIIIANHTSGLDPLLIQSVCPRLVVWMMAREFYDIPSLNWLFRAVEAIPVERSGRDLAATRAALRALAAGRILGIFPEGKIAPSRELLPFQTGVAMMAMKQDVPVFPAYLDGTQRGRDMIPAVLIPCRATLAFGRPLRLSGDLDAATAELQSAVAALQHRVLNS